MIFDRQGRLLLKQRAGDARRLAGFFDLPDGQDLPATRSRAPIGSFKHGIVNHSYTCTVAAAKVPRSLPGSGWVWMEVVEMPKIPLSTTARKALNLFHSEQSGKKGVPSLVTAGS